MITNVGSTELMNRVSTEILRIDLGSKRTSTLNGYVLGSQCKIDFDIWPDFTLHDSTELWLHLHFDCLFGARFRGSVTSLQSVANAPQVSCGSQAVRRSYVTSGTLSLQHEGNVIFLYSV